MKRLFGGEEQKPRTELDNIEDLIVKKQFEAALAKCEHEIDEGRVSVELLKLRYRALLRSESELAVIAQVQRDMYSHELLTKVSESSLAECLTQYQLAHISRLELQNGFDAALQFIDEAINHKRNQTLQDRRLQCFSLQLQYLIDQDDFDQVHQKMAAYLETDSSHIESFKTIVLSSVQKMRHLQGVHLDTDYHPSILATLDAYLTYSQDDQEILTERYLHLLTYSCQNKTANCQSLISDTFNKLESHNDNDIWMRLAKFLNDYRGDGAFQGIRSICLDHKDNAFVLLCLAKVLKRKSLKDQCEPKVIDANVLSGSNPQVVFEHIHKQLISGNEKISEAVLSRYQFAHLLECFLQPPTFAFLTPVKQQHFLSHPDENRNLILALLCLGVARVLTNINVDDAKEPFAEVDVLRYLYSCSQQWCQVAQKDLSVHLVNIIVRLEILSFRQKNPNINLPLFSVVNVAYINESLDLMKKLFPDQQVFLMTFNAVYVQSSKAYRHFQKLEQQEVRETIREIPITPTTPSPTQVDGVWRRGVAAFAGLFSPSAATPTIHDRVANSPTDSTLFTPPPTPVDFESALQQQLSEYEAKYNELMDKLNSDEFVEVKKEVENVLSGVDPELHLKKVKACIETMARERKTVPDGWRLYQKFLEAHQNIRLCENGLRSFVTPNI